MKKLILISTIAISLFVVSCKPKSEQLVGKWTVSECTITNLDMLRKKSMMDVPDSLLDQYKEKLEKEITSFIDDAKKEVYTFEKDSCTTSHGDKNEKGSWKISSDMKMLFIIPNDNPRVEAINLDELTGKEIKFSRKLSADNTAIYTLKKQ